MAFTNDCRRLISVSGDGCIFIWRLSADITKNIQERLSELRPRSKMPSVISELPPFKHEDSEEQDQENRSPESPSSPTEQLKQVSLESINLELPEGIKLGDTLLPSWAKSKASDAKGKATPKQPAGRWAQVHSNQVHTILLLLACAQGWHTNLFSTDRVQ